nr:VacJ family lipoprotein [Rhodospirillales bacterium]
MFIFLQKKAMSSFFVMLMIAISLLLSGCAGNKAIEADPELMELSEVDPYEELNRDIFVFNTQVDKYFAKPISKGYLWVTPQFVRTGVANFFSNLNDINVILNDVMQGKIEQSGEDTSRFLVNTTVGLAGLFDVASELGLGKHDEDFAQTLAVWGVPQGPYLVFPVLGPMTSRGVPGTIFDTAANPATYVGVPVQLLQMLNARANAEGALQFIDEAALDPYIFTRESFLQHRNYLITDGNSEITDDVLLMEDDFYDDEEILSAVPTQETAADITINQPEVAPIPAMTNTAVQQSEAAASGYKFILSSENENFGQAADSFEGATSSFDKAVDSFAEAAEKIEKLQ